MVRIIPWNLPPVNGGSIGGYTPDSGGSDPEPVVQYFDFSNAYVSLNGTADKVGAGITGDEVVDMGSGSWTSLVHDIQLLDIIGVGSIGLNIKGTYSTYSVDISYDITLGTYKLTLVNGTCTPSLSGGNYQVTITEYHFYVYNGNGEVIQSYDKVVGE